MTAFTESVVEQAALAPEAAAVAGEVAVGADHAVAGDDDPERVVAHRRGVALWHSAVTGQDPARKHDRAGLT